MAERLRVAGIAYGRVSEMEDLTTHPQNRYVSDDTPAGPVRLLAPGAVLDGAPATTRAVPALGAQTDALRRDFADD